ncbi:hypothetical protein D9M69_229180 [compost metagenome]
MRSASSGIHSRDSPTNTAVLIAMQRWPAAPQLEPIRLLITWSLCASGRITMWFFAPANACTRFRCAVPVR